MIPLMVIILSFMLEGVLSIIFTFNTNLFASTFCLLSLFFIYPFMKEIKNYIIISFILGLIYDITYTGTILLNAFIFLIIAFRIIKLYKTFQMNLFNIIIINICLIILYRFITYLFLFTINTNPFNIITLLESIYSSLILNIIYILLTYFILTRKGCKKMMRNSKI